MTCEFAPATMFDWTKVALASSVLIVNSATAFAGSVPPTVYSTVALPVYGYDWWNFVTFTVGSRSRVTMPNAPHCRASVAADAPADASSASAATPSP